MNRKIWSRKSVNIIVVVVVVVYFLLSRWKILLAARASEDHLESTVLKVTLDLPDLQDIMAQRGRTLDLPDLPDLRDIMVLRALQDRQDYLVFRVFVDHLGSMVPRVHLDPGPVPAFIRPYLALACQQPQSPDKKLQRRNKTYVELKIVKVDWFWQKNVLLKSALRHINTWDNIYRSKELSNCRTASLRVIKLSYYFLTIDRIDFELKSKLISSLLSLKSPSSWNKRKENL